MSKTLIEPGVPLRSNKIGLMPPSALNFAVNFVFASAVRSAVVCGTSATPGVSVPVVGPGLGAAKAVAEKASIRTMAKARETNFFMR